MAVVQADDGCPIHYSVEGEGESLLLIAGLGGLASFWAPARSHLAGFRVITFDHRGTGASGRPETGHTVGRIAQDAMAILDDLGLVRVHVVGHSTGGAVAQVLAAEHPERVSRLVISGTWARPDMRFRLLFETRLDVLLRAGPETYQRLTHVLGYTPDWLETHADELAGAVAAASEALAPLAAAAARVRMLLEWAGLDDLGRVSAPTLVLAATDDLIIPFRHGESLASKIPDASLVRMSGGHFYPRTDPARFGTAVSKFLRQEVP